MSSLEEKQKLKTSIRPNGKIRPIPKNAQSQISLNDIKPGNALANFHDEYLYDRFYKAENVEQLLKTTGQNPFTRQSLTRTNIEPYYASINGDTGGKTIPNVVTLASNSEYTQVKVTFEPGWSKKYIEIEVYTGEPLVNSTKQFIVEKNTPLAHVLGKFMETTFDSHWNTLETKYISLFGIRDSPNSFLLKPAYHIYLNEEIFITDYSVPISTYVSSLRSNKLFFKETIENYTQVLQIQVPNLPRTPAYFGVLSSSWIGIQYDILADIHTEFKNWLLAHPTEYEEYKKGNFTENTIKKGAEIRQYSDKKAYDNFSQRVASLGRRRWGGTRRSVRRSKKTIRKKTTSK